MILVTGGTGFIGHSLIRRLVDEGHDVRVLIRPSTKSPRLPRGVRVEAAISSLADERGLRAALVGVDTIYHLAGVNWLDIHADVRATEIEGTRNLLEMAQDAGAQRILYVSHLGADRASGYPVLKAKGIAEERIRQSGMPYTILRSAIVYGPNDHFTTVLAQLLAAAPGMMPMPGGGEALLQPLWVEDLVSCLTLSLEEEKAQDALIEVGGPEHLSLQEIVTMVMRGSGIEKPLVPTRPSYLRILNKVFSYLAPRFPTSNYWLDYLAAHRVCELDRITRVYGIMPARISQRLEHLQNVEWRTRLRARLQGRFV
jgi:NADH dehydrogenase